MTSVSTLYGTFEEVTGLEFYSGDKLSHFFFHSPYDIATQAGELRPLYFTEDLGRRRATPVYLHENGVVKSVPLQKQQPVATSIGDVNAERITFHNNGAVRRVFPLDGKLSGYWNEKDEKKMAETISIRTSFGELAVKPISILFFPSTALRSVTLWPGEKVEIETPAGAVAARTGISFYENGALRSLEPLKPTMVATSIGSVSAFDPDPEGISGDINSLQFAENGSIKSMLTSNSTVSVTTKDGNTAVYEPTRAPGMCSDLVRVTVPLLIEFFNGMVRFNNNKHEEYSIEECSFSVDVFSGSVTKAMEYSC